MNAADIVRKYVDDRIRPTGGDNVQARCPFHKGGEERNPSFSINLRTGVAQCFTCGWTGMFHRLLLELKVPHKVVEHVLSGITFDVPEMVPLQRRNRFAGQFVLPEWVLGAFNRCPVHLLEAGFSMDLMQEYEVGVDIHNNRVTWPVRDLYGSLVGVVGGPMFVGQHPKYSVYKDDGDAKGNRMIRTVLGDFVPAGYQINNHHFLWNAYRALNTEGPVIIVEGFKACLWLIQHGYPNTVAIQGSFLSKRQRDTLVKIHRPVHIFLDNNDAGKEGASKSAALIGSRLPTKIIDYGTPDESLQPDDLKPRYLEKVMNRPENPGTWRKRHGLRRIPTARRP